ncbi:MAG: hypothetical protein ABW352_17900 [Polyangiales bacterium]
MNELLIKHAQPLRAATSIRSTVLQSSLASLRSRGHFDAWSRAMDPIHRTAVAESLAPSWMPIEIALAHYQACEAINLPLSEQVAMGEAVGDRIQGTFLATLMKSARASGLSPLILFKQFDRLYGRLFEGGSIQLTQTGPKDLEVEIAGLPLSRYAYFRTAFTGVVRAGFVFSGVRSNYVKQHSYNAKTESFVLRAAWV